MTMTTIILQYILILLIYCALKLDVDSTYGLKFMEVQVTGCYNTTFMLGI